MLNKLFYCLLSFLAGMVVMVFGLFILREIAPSFGYRIDFLVTKEEYKTYRDKKNAFTVDYPSSFAFDAGEEAVKRYGNDYLVGFKHKNDPRIGCEVRKQDVNIDILQSKEFFYNQFMALFGKSARDIKITRSQRVRIGNRQGYQFNVVFTDPLNAVEAVNHIFIPQGQSTYLLICGAGKAYFDTFAREFKRFFNSFRLQ